MRGESEAGPGWAWAATAQLAVPGHRNRLRHAGGFSPMLTDVQTYPDVANRQACEFPNTLEKTKLISHGKSAIWILKRENEADKLFRINKCLEIQRS
jgi:hypothetical protein